MIYQELFDNAQELTGIAREMHITGMPVDKDRRAYHHERLIRERDEADKKFREFSGFEGNMNSDEELVKVFKKYGWEPQKFTETGEEQLDKGVIRDLINSPIPPVRTLSEYLLARKQANTTDRRYIGEGYAGEKGAYGLKVLQSTNRHHPTFGVCAAETLRFTCQGGAQQIQKPTVAEVILPNGERKLKVVREGTRDIFVAPPGWLWLESDFKALELRLYTMYAGIGEWFEAFLKDLDVHELNTAAALKKPIELVTKTERDLIKTWTFGGGCYGGKDATVWAQVVNKYPRIKVEQLAEIRKNVYDKYKRIPEYQQEAIREAMRHGYTPLATGDRIVWKFPGLVFDGKPVLYGKPKSTEILNKRMQRTAANLMNKGMVKARKLIDDRYCKFVLQLHDALHVLVREDHLQDQAAAIREAMETTLTWLGRTMPFTVEQKAGPSWGDLKGF